MAKSVPIAARIDADLDGQLERLAEATGRSKSWLVNEALRSYVANEQQFLAAVEEGKQALNWGLLKGQHNPGYAGNKSGQEVYRVQKFQHPRSGVSAEGKVH